MDRETLSRFGWIIVSAIVITVIMGFIFSLVWVLGDDSVDSAKEILHIGLEEDADGGATSGAKPVVTVKDSYFGYFNYEITGTGFDSIRFYKGDELVKTLNDSTGGLRKFRFDSEAYYEYQDKITIKCYKKDVLIASGNGIYDFLDTIPPTLDVIVDVASDKYIGNKYYVNAQNVTIHGKVTDTDNVGKGGSGIASFTVNGDAVTVAADNSWSTSVSLAEGTNTITIVAIDGSKNKTTETVTVYYDKKAPTLTVSTPNGGTSKDPILVYGNGAYMVSGTVSDGTGIGIQTVKVNGKNATVNNDGSWSLSINLDPLKVTTVTVVATDKLGNQTTSTTRYLRWINWPDAEGALQFISNKPFKLSAPSESWEGNMEYHNGYGWQSWNGSEISAGKQDAVGSNYCLYVRGKNNTKVTKTTKTVDKDEWTFNPWTISGTDVHCNGNVETLLNYEMVKNKNHPTQGEYCYAGMFKGSTALVTAPSLSATTLSDYCYIAMFNSCTNLTTAPSVLPAATLTESCYRGMFDSCAKLTTAPTISATKTAKNSCNYMFANCTSLVEAPALKATIAADYCYYYMFYNCQGLTTAPSSIPATTLAENCYHGMFKGCTKLTKAPSLPATTLASYCYQSMFEGCTKLTSAPALPAMRVAKYCYLAMFKNCTSLKTAPALPATRLFLSAADDTELHVGYDGSRCYSFMFEGCTSLTSAPALPAENWMSYGAYYGMFKNCTSLTATPKLPAWFLTEKCYESMFEGCIKLTKVNSIAATNIGVNGCFKMFYGCTSITTVPNLKVEYVATQGCKQMFEGCTSLTKAPELPATLLYSEYTNEETNEETVYTGEKCYERMFYGCTSLTTVPNLPATLLTESCYRAMFKGCTKLTTLPILSAEFLATACCEEMFMGCTGITQLPDGMLEVTALYRVDENDITKHYNGAACYRRMFSGCIGLTEIPKDFLPAKNLAYGCYIEMFKGCTNLKTVPKDLLPSFNNPDPEEGNGAHQDAYKGMFSGCTSLTNAPDLPAILLAKGCYESMFEGCTSLKVAPDLPATILHQTVNGKEYDAIGCYKNMFSGCTSLKVAPELPATTLAEACYQNMFLGCTALTSIPELPATNLPANCYNSMFSGCSSVKVSASMTNGYAQKYPILATKTGTDSLKDMFISTGGDFKGTPTAGTYYLPGSVNIIKDPVGYLEFTSTKSFTLNVSNPGWTANSMEYNIGKGWKPWNGAKITAGQNEDVYYIYIRGTGNSVITGNYKDRNWTLTDTDSAGIMCNGNIETLLDYNTVKLGNHPTMADYCYRNLFYNCTSLVKAPALPATTLTSGCYYGMFAGSGLTTAPTLKATTLKAGCYREMFMDCTSLAAAPALPATTLTSNCYRNMFEGCTKLTTAPILNAATLAANCYYGMFKGCSSLTTAPSKLPATTLANSCYFEMFMNCTSLTKAPTLSATAMAEYSCKSMFAGCTKLTTAPKLSATTLAKECYYGMFKGCTKLTTAPTISATTLADSCCYEMFMNCTSLTTAPTLSAMTLASSCYQNMFYGCTSLKKSPALPATTLAANCYYGMFKGCTKLTTVQTLSATTLASDCCREMFMNCTSLTTVPRNLLPATTLKADCYRSMFQGCTALKTVPLLPATTLSAGCYAYMFYGCANLAEIPYLPATTLANYCYNYMFGNAITSVSAERTDAYRTEYTMPITKAHVASKTYPISQMFGEGTSNSYYSIFNTDVAPFYLPTGIKVVGKDFLEFASTESFTITATKKWKNIEYSIDGGKTWTTWVGGMISSSNSDYHYIYLRGTNNTVITGYSANDDIYWTLDGTNISCNGNIEYLLDYNTVMSGEHPKMDAYCYESMFRGCEDLIKAPDLSAVTLTSGCYRSMFRECTGLTKAPELPAMTTVHQCYAHMFNGCTSLKDAPDLPATNAANSCYSHMFYGCTSLETVSALPATALDVYCYYRMFYGCKSLKEIPYLPATELVNHCYNSMFNGTFDVSTTKTGNFTVQYIMPITKAEVDSLMQEGQEQWPVSSMFNSSITFGTTQTVIYLPSSITIVYP